MFLTFLGLVLFPSTYYYWSTSGGQDANDDPEKKKKGLSVHAKETTYFYACEEKETRLKEKNPWVETRRKIFLILIMIGWVLIGIIIYNVSQFDYEMANFDPYEILGVTYDSSAKEIKKKYREMSLKYHPDKPTGNEKLFMKLTKAYVSDCQPLFTFLSYKVQEHDSVHFLTNMFFMKVVEIHCYIFFYSPGRFDGRDCQVQLGTLWQSRRTPSHAIWNWFASLDCGRKEFYLGFGRVHAHLHDWPPIGRLLLVVEFHQVLWRTSASGHYTTLLLLFPQDTTHDP